MSEPGAPVGVRFELLGPLRAWRGGHELAIGSPAQNLLLAVLLARAGQPTGVDELVGQLWDDQPPASAVNVIQRYVGALRRLVEPDLPARSPGHWLVRHPGGYGLQVDAASSDLVEFRARVQRARRAENADDALAEFNAALALWRGPCAAGLMMPGRARALLAGIDQEGLATVVEAADVAHAAGRPLQPLLLHLERAVKADPFNETVHARLMLALDSVGRRAAALEVYREIRKRLVDELGVEPGAELTRMQHDVLTQQAEEVPAVRAPQARPVVRPAQLPPDLPTFTGRRDQLTRLAGLFDCAAERRRVTVAVIDGLAGTGKTSLAIHLAHQVAERFPDGQLYVNMRGFDPTGATVDPADALRGFLDVLGIEATQAPSGLDARSGLYRSLLAGRQMLVVLDNVRDSEQVRPLLPGSAGSAVIVTSRNRLSALVATEDADVLTLDTLSSSEARETLVRRLGEEKVAAEPEAVEEIIELCGRLPLALAIVAARARTHPQFSLADITAKLRATQGTLEAFRGDSAGDVRTVFSWSYRVLEPGAARLFRLLSLHRGADFSTAAAASLAGVPLPQAQDLLEELTRIRYLSEHRPGRYLAHDLVRSYAMELREQTDPADEQADALARLVNHYLCSTHGAYLALNPHQLPIDPPVLEPGVTADLARGYGEAMEWFEAELPALTLLIRQIAGVPRLAGNVCKLVLSLQPYYQRSALYHDWVTQAELALRVAVGTGDLAAQANVHRSLAGAYHFVERYDEALEHLNRTAELFEQLGLAADQAYVHSNFGTVFAKLGRFNAALEHHERAFELYRASGNVKGEAIGLEGIGRCLSEMGGNAEAVPLILRAMKLYEDIGDRNGEGNCWSTLATAYGSLGHLDQAIDAWRRAVTYYRELGNRSDESDSLVALGDALSASGDPEGAEKAWREALHVLDAFGMPAADDVRLRLGDPDSRVVSPPGA
ncbi:BTAD domain-containing putative transcriptional regulator [Amycolatopsis sp. NPDC051373]|uniref:AfsR/SARP family transcriptional regulator n=1 Tax=Amycolatopsis sp. NPDC051373 TaxID=3155801 RepID=UPI00344BAC5F